MATEKNIVKDIYSNVVNDVIDGVREAFLDDGMDELVLQELKQLWESKLSQCKAIARAPPPPAAEPRALISPSRPQQSAQPHFSPAVVQLQQQPNAAAAATSQLQSQLMRIQAAQQAAASGAVYSSIPQLPTQAQITQNTLNAAFLRHLATYASSPNSVALQGLPMASFPQVVPADFNMLAAIQKPVIQLDGLGDSSSEEDEDHEDDDNDDDEDDDQNEDADANVEEEDPLNSGDDVSDADPTEVFDAENVVVCQFEKINRCKNRWKFHLKDGIMNLNGRDFLFQKANGDAEW